MPASAVTATRRRLLARDPNEPSRESCRAARNASPRSIACCVSGVTSSLAATSIDRSIRGSARAKAALTKIVAAMSPHLSVQHPKPAPTRPVRNVAFRPWTLTSASSVEPDLGPWTIALLLHSAWIGLAAGSD